MQEHKYFSGVASARSAFTAEDDTEMPAQSSTTRAALVQFYALHIFFQGFFTCMILPWILQAR